MTLPVEASQTSPGLADRDTPKSRRTRRRILDAAMKLFATIGYDAATNASIAEASDLTRGAMLYHFPTREALVEAAIAHIQSMRTALFQAATADIDSDADPADHAIDAYWTLLSTEPFLAFRELESVARTNATMAALLAPAQREFDRAQAGDNPLALVHAGMGPRFQASRDLARFMLEGMAQADLTYDREGRTERLLTIIKRVTHMLNRKGAVADIWPE